METKKVTKKVLLRQSMIAACIRMNDIGLNQGTSGNISVREGDHMLITPSATPYEDLRPAMIASMPLKGDYGTWKGPKIPSTEWRFHLDIMKARPQVGAIIHLHAPFCTALAITRKAIPACHYMIAAFGGNNVRCAGYARYGTKALSTLALKALKDRYACLLANHGMIALGETLNKAVWRAIELEGIAKQYIYACQAGKPVILNRDDIKQTSKGFESYGLKES